MAGENRYKFYKKETLELKIVIKALTKKVA